MPCLGGRKQTAGGLAPLTGSGASPLVVCRPPSFYLSDLWLHAQSFAMCQLTECLDYPYEPGRHGPMIAHAHTGLSILPRGVPSISTPYIGPWQHCVAAHCSKLRSMHCRKVGKATCHDGRAAPQDYANSCTSFAKCSLAHHPYRLKGLTSVCKSCGGTCHLGTLH